MAEGETAGGEDFVKVKVMREGRASGVYFWVYRRLWVLFIPLWEPDECFLNEKDAIARAKKLEKPIVDRQVYP